MRSVATLAPCVLILAITSNSYGQAESPAFSLPDLQTSMTHHLLYMHDGPLEPLIDHLWKSNGGAILPRTAQNEDSREFAGRLAQLIAFDEDSRTLYWPVYGFHDPTSLRFSPTLLWGVVEPYFLDAGFDGDESLVWRDNFVAALNTRPAKVDPLAPPVGLTLPAQEILWRTGNFGTALFVYSPRNCFELAVKCYWIGLVHDARVLLSHAIAQSPEAKFYYVRGTIEMLIGVPEDAKMSALGYIATTTPPVTAPASYIYERVNGPPAIQFRELVAEMLLR